MKANRKSFFGITLSAFLAAGFVVLSSTGVFAQEKEEKSNAKLARQAKITMAEAREIALRAAPGKIEDAELEKEKGKLVYSFDIRNQKGTISEVWVDAKTGAVLSNTEETKADEEKEKREDENQERKNKKPNAVSTVKDGAVDGLAVVGRGAQTIARKTTQVFKH